jgi:NlpC/P60 family
VTQYYRDNGGAAALSFARRLTGEPYKFGGTAPGPTDCSGLVEWSYQQVGVFLSRTTYTQYETDPINNKGIASEAGDLLFIPGSDAIGVLPGHVMIYVSPGQVFQAEQTGTLIGQFAYNTDLWEYRSRPALSLPFAPAPPAKPTLPPAKGTPTAAELQQTNLVKLPNVAAANLAVRNGWTLWYFSIDHFVPQIGGEPTGVALYANAGYKKPR